MAEPLFSAFDVAELRVISDASMPHRALVERPHNAAGAGGTIRREPYAQVASGVPCRLSTLSTTEVERAGIMQPNASWTVVFPAGFDVRQGDRLTITGATIESGTLAALPFAEQIHVIGALAPGAHEAMRKVYAGDVPPTERG